MCNNAKYGNNLGADLCNGWIASERACHKYGT